MQRIVSIFCGLALLASLLIPATQVLAADSNSGKAIDVDSAQFISQSVPLTATLGQTFTASITMKNTGTTTWTKAGNYKLGSQNPAGNKTWGLNRVELAAGEAIAPGQSKTFIFTAKAPTATGNYNFQFKMVRENVRWFGGLSTNVSLRVANETDAAKFVSQTMPASVKCGQSFKVSITMKNTGTSTWTKAANYKLGTQNPVGNNTWGLNRVELAAGESIAPGQSKTFIFTATSPAVPLIRNVQFKMVRENVRWFGEESANISMKVSNEIDSSRFVSQSVPVTVAVPAVVNHDQTFPVTIIMDNTGTSTWTKAENYKLGSQNPAGNNTWGLSRVELFDGEAIAPEQSKMFTFTAKAPAATGVYNFQFKMVRELVGWFGEPSANISIKVVDDNVAPTGTIVINDQDQYTKTAEVTLSLSATDATSGVRLMQFSNDNITWSSIEPYSATKSWDLSTGDGTKTVYVRYSDGVGNWSGAYSDTITLDTVGPDVALSRQDGDQVLGFVSTVAYATDVGSGSVARVEFWIDGVLESTDTEYPYVHTWNACYLDNGPHTIRATAYDILGNYSQKEITVELHNMFSLVRASGHQILVQKRLADGTLAPEEAYIMHGVAWSPASAGMDGSFAARRAQFAEWVDIDAPLMEAMNVNTVRTYLDFGTGEEAIAVLDKLYAHGIMVIMSVDGEGTYDDATVSQIVRAYRNHPAILMWMVGNEWNINCYGAVDPAVREPTVAERDLAAEKTKSLATTIYWSRLTPGLIATGYGDVSYPDLATTQRYVTTTCSSIGVWGINVYRGSNFGATFAEWDSISTKPMFISEFGTDSYRAAAYGEWPITGSEDEEMQAAWDVSLWNDLYNNLSAKDPSKVSIGGAVFEWNDEWWKVPASKEGDINIQDNGGYYSTWNPGAFPDGCGNEEYFGIVTIDRVAKKAYAALKTVFDPNYDPSPTTVSYEAESKGTLPGSTQWNTYAHFWKNGTLFYSKAGDQPDGRGVNVAVINGVTGEVENSQNFDTYASAANATALANYLNALPNGKIILFAIADEGKANLSPAISTLVSLGSQHINDVVIQGSWAMIVKKGDPTYYAENYGSDAAKHVTCNIPLDPS